MTQPRQYKPNYWQYWNWWRGSMPYTKGGYQVPLSERQNIMNNINQFGIPTYGAGGTASLRPPKSSTSTASTGGIQPVSRWEIVNEGGWDWQVGYDKNGNVISKDALGRTETAKKGMGYAEAIAVLNQLDPNKTGAFRMDYDETLGGYSVDPDPNFTPTRDQDQRAADEKYRQDMLDMQRQQFEQQMVWNREQQAAQIQAQKEQRLAQLKANPGSWLEYAALSGQAPVVQPWMQPLMKQQYEQQSQPAVGSTLTTDFKNLPELTTPSAQYMARTTPSGREQYYGYEQARTGATPEDVQWRLWSQAPPSGQYGGLRRTR